MVCFITKVDVFFDVFCACLFATLPFPPPLCLPMMGAVGALSVSVHAETKCFLDLCNHLHDFVPWETAFSCFPGARGAFHSFGEIIKRA